MPRAAALPECIGAVFDCENPFPKCVNSFGFDFHTLWQITHQYWEQCPSGPWLYREPGFVGNIPLAQASLTNQVCKSITGSAWKEYASAQIWNRMTTWKFPLFQLISNSPRTPLGFAEEAFFIIHLLGDPIGSITDLIRKMHTCQERAMYWKNKLNDDKIWSKLQGHEGEDEVDRERLWKALTLIVVSYDEWGSDVGDAIRDNLEAEFFFHCRTATSEHDRFQFVRLCLESASLLAADRATNFLPVVVAQAFFIGAVIIAIIQTRSLAEGFNPQTYIDIETYSIGFTALYFWVIFAVILTSAIGASQTADSIPNILMAFRRNLSNAFSYRTTKLTNNLVPEHRYRRGGIYSWQPDELLDGLRAGHSSGHEKQLLPQSSREERRGCRTRRMAHRLWLYFYSFIRPCNALPFLSVALGTFMGMILTSLVPPDGWSCRSSAEITIFLVWILSYPFTLVPWGRHHRIRFWFTFGKDFVAMAATLGLVIATQIGIFNKCSCYTGNGMTGIALPENPLVKATLEHRLVTVYPAIVAVGIVVQLLILPGIVVARYPLAFRVFLQRDDGKSNRVWLSEIGRSFTQAK